MYMVTVETKEHTWAFHTNKRPSKRKLKSDWGKSLILTSIKNETLCIPWREIQSVSVYPQKG